MDRAFPYAGVVEPSKTALALAENLNRLMKGRMDLDSNPKLSKRSGLPVSTLSRLRNGNVEATLQVVERLAEAFTISPARLIDADPAAWPFSQDLHAAVARLLPDQLVVLENVMRATLRMEPIQNALQVSERAGVQIDNAQTPPAEIEQSTTGAVEKSRYSGGSGKATGNRLTAVKLAQKWAGKSVFGGPATKKDGAKDGTRSSNRKAPRK